MCSAFQLRGTVFSLIIAPVFYSNAVQGICEKINTQSPIVAHSSVRVRPHMLVPVLKWSMHVVECARCVTCIHIP